MQSWNTDRHLIADTDHATVTFTGGIELVLADWQTTEAAPDRDGRVYATLRGWIANTEGSGTHTDPYTRPVQAGRAQLVLAELRGREPLRDLPVHIDIHHAGKPHPNTWDHPGYLCTLTWLARRVDAGGNPVLETEIGSTRWTDPDSGREWDLSAAYLPEGEPYNPLGFVWRHYDGWSGGVPLLLPFYGGNHGPACGAGSARPITDGPWVEAAAAPAITARAR
ncbi:hypothetical protein ABT093_30680 [Kitasatospora sp. NPDC002551]|uniref:hypothetical protein n=1 Tax=Kitasatospora sp. NPDC002551 TaxID=3154539 RepID=UPI003329024A